MQLVLIETSGNQNYIFSTNKLKENIGASELTYLAGTKWVLEAVQQVTNSALWTLWADNYQLINKLLDETLNKPITSSDDVKVEVIIATSGKALLLIKDKVTAKRIIQYVTHKALIEAPGLDICGVIHGFDWYQETLGEANRKIHQEFATFRSQRPAPDLRFLRLPVIDECSTSGLPASEIGFDFENKPVIRSVVSSSKVNYSEKGLERIRELIKKENPGINFPGSIRELIAYPDKEGRWLSVIHADGNGLGEIFINFNKHIEICNQNCAEANRNYVDKLRRFSIALDICTEKAFNSAIHAFDSPDKKLVMVIPLVLGGDDLTVVCDGKNAIKFTQIFLKSFEEETRENKIISAIAEKALGVNRLSACAGIAIIKPKFPFSVAYKLAESLMQSAKEVKKKVTHPETEKPYPCSAFDFHILYDSSNIDFKSIRSKLESKGQKLHVRPYVVTAEADIQGAKDLKWARFHQFYKLKEKIQVLLAKDENNNNKRQLPNSQIHDLRAGLFLGKSIADARYLLIKNRYIEQGIITLAGSEDSLFQKEETDSEIYITGLLDAIDAAEFLNVEEKNNEQKG
ncbi:MAG: hypothetical protein V7K27_35225 [Nostoc sp.]|uniref:Cas10/Cmr2 second palm domain-containing protein n=1 Tax=Nostoc sp. TaxID=1180 RepID=UPI002FFB4C7A